MQSRSNGVRTAAANLTSLERERRSKSAAQGGGRPLVAKSARPGRRRQVFLLLVGSRKKEKAAADAKQGNGASGAGAAASASRSRDAGPARTRREPACCSLTLLWCTARGERHQRLRPFGQRRRSSSPWCGRSAAASALPSTSGTGKGCWMRRKRDCYPLLASAVTCRSECGEGAFCLCRRRTMLQAGQQHYPLFGS
eukprot:tig00021762_g23468.t1